MYRTSKGREPKGALGYANWNLYDSNLNIFIYQKYNTQPRFPKQFASKLTFSYLCPALSGGFQLSEDNLCQVDMSVCASAPRLTGQHGRHSSLARWSDVFQVSTRSYTPCHQPGNYICSNCWCKTRRNLFLCVSKPCTGQVQLHQIASSGRLGQKRSLSSAVFT